MLRSVWRWFRRHGSYLFVVLLFFFSLVRIEDLSHQVHETCRGRQVRYEALRSLVIDIVQDYPEARREAIITEMNTGLPPVKC